MMMMNLKIYLFHTSHSEIEYKKKKKLSNYFFYSGLKPRVYIHSVKKKNIHPK